MSKRNIKKDIATGLAITAIVLTPLSAIAWSIGHKLGVGDMRQVRVESAELIHESRQVVEDLNTTIEEVSE